MTGILLFTTSLSLKAQWSGFPISDTVTNYLTWEQLILDYNPVSQIVAAVNERCVAAQRLPVKIIQDVSVGSVTNPVIVTVTNAFGKFVSGSYTGFNYFTRGVFADHIDPEIKLLCSSFVSTNPANTNIFNDWFARSDPQTNHPQTFPTQSFNSLIWHLGIGHSEKPVSNSFGLVTSAVSRLTRAPTTQATWLLEYTRWTGSNWTEYDAGIFDVEMIDPMILPVVYYSAAGTNPLAPLSVTIEGVILDVTNLPTLGENTIFISAQNTLSTSENLTVSVPYESLTLPWYSVTNISVSGSANNTGDTIYVMWTNRVVLFGNIGVRYYAKMFDERQKIIDALRWTTRSTPFGGVGNNPYGWTTTESYRVSYTTNSFSAAKLGAENTWPSNAPSIYNFSCGTVLEKNWIDWPLYATNYTARIDNKIFVYSPPTFYTVIPTSILHEVDVYYVGEHFSGVASIPHHEVTEFDSVETDLREDLYSYLGSSTSVYKQVDTKIYFGTGTNRPIWANDSLLDPNSLDTNVVTKGFELRDHNTLMLIRWDIPGGFRFQ